MAARHPVADGHFVTRGQSGRDLLRPITDVQLGEKVRLVRVAQVAELDCDHGRVVADAQGRVDDGSPLAAGATSRAGRSICPGTRQDQLA